MSKGYVILAQNTEEDDYVRQAYALALSIQATQQIKDVTLLTNDPVPEEYKSVFNNIIPIPWEDTVSRFRAENRWKIYHITPYDETIVLDSDMLMLKNIDNWWWYAQDHDLLFCSQTLNFKGDKIDNSVYRKTFTENQLPNAHFALHYFKKSETAERFYKTLEFVVNNWAWCYGKFAPEYYQDWLSMDLAAAIALEITGLNACADACSPMKFIHMKPGVQDWTPVPTLWTDTIPHIFTRDGEMIVGNIKQNFLFHYIEKDFVKDGDIIYKLKEIIDGR